MSNNLLGLGGWGSRGGVRLSGQSGEGGLDINDTIAGFSAVRASVTP